MIYPAPKPVIVRDTEFEDFVRGLPCVCGCGRPGAPHHVKPRRPYGDAHNIVPVYPECHQEGHTIGWDTWQERKGVKLQPIADILWMVWTGSN